jgi:hypothetical protein
MTNSTRNKAFSIAITVVAITLAWATPATSQTTTPTLTATTAPAPFLTPLPWRFLMSPDDPRRPRICRQSTSTIQCPDFVAHSGAAGGIPTIDPAVKADLPHVRVTFLVHRIHNQVIANGGLDLGAFAWPWTWTTSGSAANVESDGGGYILPTPGQIWTENNTFLIRLYDALVFNACDSFMGFPVDHTTDVHNPDGSVIGVFHGVDNTTLDDLGFYDFQFTVRAEGDRGRVSDFHFSGKVSVTCSGLNALP